VTPTDLVRFLRYQLVKKGMIPEEISELYEEIKKDSDRLRDKGETSLAETDLDSTIDTVLFVENRDHLTTQASYQSAIRLLEKIGKFIAFFSGETSLYELYDLGFWDELTLVVQRKEKEMEKLDGKKVIFLDPHWQEFMVKRYPEIAFQSPTIEARHVSEVLLEAIKEGKLKAKKEKIKVAYHDPCHLSRGLGIHDVPRKLLNSLGVDLVEMHRSGSDTYCCGAGCKNTPFPNFSNWVTSERMKEFKETGAQLLITACPHCKTQFRKFLPNGEKDLVLDLVEFVEQRTR
jgi:Fe-S oxidoreductase